MPTVRAGPIAAECRHHWKIAPPNGPTSRGKCKRCRAVRDFLNYVARTAYREYVPRPVAHGEVLT